MTLAPLILLILIMYFLLIRPQKKREKQVNAMRSAIKVGDDIITIGGICGKVVKTKDDTLIIQVGADKTKFEVMRWSISKVVNEAPSAPAKKTVKETEPEEEQTETKKTLPKKLKKASEATENEANDHTTKAEPSATKQEEVAPETETATDEAAKTETSDTVNH